MASTLLAIAGAAIGFCLGFGAVLLGINWLRERAHRRRLREMRARAFNDFEA